MAAKLAADAGALAVGDGAMTLARARRELGEETFARCLRMWWRYCKQQTLQGTLPAAHAGMCRRAFREVER